MQISLRQAEIEKAVVDYIADQGITIAHKEITVNFTAGRGENKLSAEINIEPLGSNFIAQVEESVREYTVQEEASPAEAEAKQAKTVGGLFS